MRLIQLIRISVWSLLLVPLVSYGYEFVPTEAEFQAWPSYCQAKYVTTPIGQASQWAGTISKSRIDATNHALGEAVFLHIHHYCSGIALVGRAKYETDATQRKFMYNTAVGELSYVATRIPAQSSFTPSALITLATAHKELGNPVAAINYLNQAIELHPENPATHIALGLFYRNTGDLKAARDALLRGTDTIGESSAELDYNLALILLELNDTMQAVAYARKAYELGYPLPGLRNKLVQRGLWEATPVVETK